MKHLLLCTGLFLFLAPAATTQCYSSDPSKCCNASTISDCPINGCGADEKLSSKKNISELPEPSAIEDWEILDMLDVTFPAHWSKNQNRSLLESWGEGKVIRLSAHLKKVKHYEDGKEACNCNLKGDDNNDFHLVLTRYKNRQET